MISSIDRIFLSASLLALTGCATPQVAIAANANDAVIEEVAFADPDIPDPDAQIVETGEYIDFSYGWPEAVEEQPELAAYLRGKATDWLAEIRYYMAEDERLADEDSEFWPEYESETDWQVAGVAGPLMSLSSKHYHYTGGAHGIYGSDALLFDTELRKVMQPVDIFADKNAARAAIQSDYCALLDDERERRRGPDYPRVDDDDSFWECIDPLEQALIFHPDDGSTGAFDRLIVYTGPYAAGPYAEGEFVIEMPVTAALIAAIRPEYRQSFTVSSRPAITEQPGV